jgi:Domain of unknown function (DUF4148)
MNTRRLMFVVAAIVGSSSALAQSPYASTRAEVRAEAIAAREAGLTDIGEGAALRQVMVAPSQRSRAEVHAEAVTAARARAGRSRFEAGEWLDQQLALPSTLSRAQVRAEAIEARRLGLVVRGDSEQRLPTASELESIRQAGLRAIGAENLARH